VGAPSCRWQGSPLPARRRSRPAAWWLLASVGLRGWREREQETCRKPFEENAGPADVILKDWNKKVKGAQAPTALESLLGSIEETSIKTECEGKEGGRQGLHYTAGQRRGYM
jgi:hypothetical protein